MEEPQQQQIKNTGEGLGFLRELRTWLCEKWRVVVLVLIGVGIIIDITIGVYYSTMAGSHNDMLIGLGILFSCIPLGLVCACGIIALVRFLRSIIGSRHSVTINNDLTSTQEASKPSISNGNSDKAQRLRAAKLGSSIDFECFQSSIPNVETTERTNKSVRESADFRPGLLNLALDEKEIRQRYEMLKDRVSHNYHAPSINSPARYFSYRYERQRHQLPTSSSSASDIESRRYTEKYCNFDFGRQLPSSSTEYSQEASGFGRKHWSNTSKQNPKTRHSRSVKSTKRRARSMSDRRHRSKSSREKFAGNAWTANEHFARGCTSRDEAVKPWREDEGDPWRNSSRFHQSRKSVQRFAECREAAGEFPVVPIHGEPNYPRVGSQATDLSTCGIEGDYRFRPKSDLVSECIQFSKQGEKSSVRRDPERCTRARHSASKSNKKILTAPPRNEGQCCFVPATKSRNEPLGEGPCINDQQTYNINEEFVAYF